MTKPDIWLKAKSLAREGNSRSAIARELGLNRRTVRRLLARDEPPAYPAAPKLIRPSKLDSFKDYVKLRLEDGITNAVTLQRELRKQGYTGGLSILRDFVLPLRQEKERQAFIRFETLPGEQAQVDWSHFVAPDAGQVNHRFYCFSMVLGYSRCLYAEFTARMDVLTLLRCHVHAFEYFGGLTRTILYDNLKQVILERDDVTQRHHFHPRFLDFANYYAFAPRVCWPCRPQTKGKMENGIRYIRISFAQGLRYTGLPDLNRQLRTWLDEVANPRIHAETRQHPFDRLKQEQLLPLPRIPYDTARIESRYVNRDCFLSYDGNWYSVPAPYIQHTVTVNDAYDGKLRIYSRDRLIAEHRLSTTKGRRVENPDHTRGIRPQRLPLQTEWRHHRDKLVRLGDILPEVLAPIVAHRPLSAYEDLLKVLEDHHD
jgi:transposase